LPQLLDHAAAASSSGRRLVDENQVIVVGWLRISEMFENRKLAPSIGAPRAPGGGFASGSCKAMVARVRTMTLSRSCAAVAHALVRRRGPAARSGAAGLDLCVRRDVGA